MAVGSSSTSIRGCKASVPAMATLCCWPPDRSSGSERASPSIPVRAKASCTLSLMVRAGRPWFSGPNATSSSTTVVTIWSSGFCCTRPMLRRAARYASRLTPETGVKQSRPINCTLPLSGAARPLSSRESVVFPDPFDPMMATHSPSWMVTSRLSSTVRVPWRKVTLRKHATAVGCAAGCALGIAVDVVAGTVVAFCGGSVAAFASDVVIAATVGIAAFFDASSDMYCTTPRGATAGILVAPRGVT